MEKRACENGADQSDGGRLPEMASLSPLGALRPGAFDYARAEVVRSANIVASGADQRLDVIERQGIIARFNHSTPPAAHSPGAPRAWSSHIGSGWRPCLEICRESH